MCERQAIAQQCQPTAVQLNQPLTAPSKPRGQVPEALGLLGSQIDELHAALDRLENRLEPILEPSPPTSEGPATAAPSGSTSALAAGLVTMASRISYAIGRINVTMDRAQI